MQQHKRVRDKHLKISIRSGLDLRILFAKYVSHVSKIVDQLLILKCLHFSQYYSIIYNFRHFIFEAFSFIWLCVCYTFWWINFVDKL